MSPDCVGAEGYPIDCPPPTLATASDRGLAVAQQEPRVAILMGSQSDWEVMRAAEKALGDLGIASDARVISAHRTPERLTRFLREAERGSIEVIIAGAGMSAHLAGVTAAHTLLPVLGVPLAAGEVQGGPVGCGARTPRVTWAPRRLLARALQRRLEILPHEPPILGRVLAQHEGGMEGRHQRRSAVVVPDPADPADRHVAAEQETCRRLA
jgi:hypothetical protein